MNTIFQSPQVPYGNYYGDWDQNLATAIQEEAPSVDILCERWNTLRTCYAEDAQNVIESVRQNNTRWLRRVYGAQLAYSLENDIIDALEETGVEITSRQIEFFEKKVGLERGFGLTLCEKRYYAKTIQASQWDYAFVSELLARMGFFPHCILIAAKDFLDVPILLYVTPDLSGAYIKGDNDTMILQKQKHFTPFGEFLTAIMKALPYSKSVSEVINEAILSNLKVKRLLQFFLLEYLLGARDLFTNPDNFGIIQNGKKNGVYTIAGVDCLTPRSLKSNLFSPLAQFSRDPGKAMCLLEFFQKYLICLLDEIEYWKRLHGRKDYPLNYYLIAALYQYLLIQPDAHSLCYYALKAVVAPKNRELSQESQRYLCQKEHTTLVNLLTINERWFLTYIEEIGKILKPQKDTSPEIYLIEHMGSYIRKIRKRLQILINLKDKIEIAPRLCTDIKADFLQIVTQSIHEEYSWEESEYLKWFKGVAENYNNTNWISLYKRLIPMWTALSAWGNIAIHFNVEPNKVELSEKQIGEEIGFVAQLKIGEKMYIQYYCKLIRSMQFLYTAHALAQLGLFPYCFQLSFSYLHSEALQNPKQYLLILVTDLSTTYTKGDTTKQTHFSTLLDILSTENPELFDFEAIDKNNIDPEQIKIGWNTIFQRNVDWQSLIQQVLMQYLFDTHDLLFNSTNLGLLQEELQSETTLKFRIVDYVTSESASKKHSKWYSDWFSHLLERGAKYELLSEFVLSLFETIYNKAQMQEGKRFAFFVNHTLIKVFIDKLKEQEELESLCQKALNRILYPRKRVLCEEGHRLVCTEGYTTLEAILEEAKHNLPSVDGLGEIFQIYETQVFGRIDWLKEQYERT